MRKPINVFISSTTQDLVHYRRVAIDVVESLNRNHGEHFPLHVVAMDTQRPDGERQTAVEASRSWVAAADWVVLIVGWHYGWTAPGECCSVTEWEYREASRETDPGRPNKKKLFVYLAGESTDGEWAYSPSDSRSLEPVDVSTYRPGSEALQRFRLELRSRTCALFRNIEDFERQLSEALSRRIFRDNAMVMGPVVAKLGLAEPLSHCFHKVRLLATHKRLHDALHRVRQYGVRKIREDLVKDWPDHGSLPMREVARLFKVAGTVGSQLERIRSELQRAPTGLKGSEDLLWVSRNELPVRLEGTRDDFVEAIDEYASRVQKAFTGCNREMAQSARKLDSAYAGLRDAVSKALASGTLPAATRKALNAQETNSSQIHERLQGSLRNHAYWQAMHDELEQLDNNLDAEGDKATEEELGEFFARHCQSGDGKPLSGRVRSMPDLLSDARAHFDSAEFGLDSWRDPMNRLGRHLKAFSTRHDLEVYGALRKAFDDLFFEVDTETLHTVERSEGRVDAMEAGLLGIEDVITRSDGAIVAAAA